MKLMVVTSLDTRLVKDRGVNALLDDAGQVIHGRIAETVAESAPRPQRREARGEQTSQVGRGWIPLFNFFQILQCPFKGKTLGERSGLGIH